MLPKTLKAPTRAPCLSTKKPALQIHFKQEMVVVVFNLNLKVKPKILTFYIGTKLS